ncbi:hypothetical protein A2933_01300 [Candidatus Nomurabacteria bacterium RIFCSPLOWO2_01_FULL_46_18]|uniref:TrbC/VIRB2 family protein n=1 Tax=Candidatus Nomurabacteria bacterium RIFCSPLOWO2_01_FULL_46_18 TaxID=1801783 RepID=A0A1F6XDW1_9BACT|nr:MAG: hypothetical protein A2933_01300 [Candidatus Nomurabacteria bacterium RIFCSPLOWO2_01_FULL_46_18]
MKNKIIVLFLGLALAMMPVLASAQVTGEFIGCAGIPLGTLEGILCKVGDILNLIVPILIALAVVIFIWGVITYVVGGDEEAKKKGRQRMIWGIIGIAVIVALWGLVRVLTNTFGVGNIENINFPTTPY